MRTFTKEELKEIVSKHRKWLYDMVGGERAYLSGANLRRANLSETDLSNADLSNADLSNANLRGANLSDAYLSGANLRRANLDFIKTDLFEILNSAPMEVPALLQTLREGRVDGTTYSGDCACLVGTIANIRKCEYNKLNGITPDPSRLAERWFLAIQEGDKPENHVVAKITEEWIEEWIDLNLKDIESTERPSEAEAE